MAATNYTPISLYYSATASNVPSASNLVAGELAINTADGKLFYKDSSNNVKVIAANVAAIANGGTGQTTATAAFNALAPSQTSNSGKFLTTDGTNTSWATVDALPSQTGNSGKYLTTNGTAASWATVAAGASLTNDVSTASTLYPLFAAATSGTPSTIYTSNAKYLYQPSTGELSASVHVSSNGLTVNSNTVSVSYSVPSGSSAMSAGPITVASGVSVTLPSGSRWVVL